MGYNRVLFHEQYIPVEQTEFTISVSSFAIIFLELNSTE
jgi:hypothetical protein